jgi:hypothetical protein
MTYLKRACEWAVRVSIRAPLDFDKLADLLDDAYRRIAPSSLVLLLDEIETR